MQGIYLFSPILSQDELFKAIDYLHIVSNEMCKKSFGKYLTNAGNVGIFCHEDFEYEDLTKMREILTFPSENPNQKYFTLREPIVKEKSHEIPKTNYKYLYIRKPYSESPYVGDVDYYLPDNEYQQAKKEISSGNGIPGARIFARPDLDMIELYDNDKEVVAYVSTLSMTEKVRVKQPNAPK